VQFRVGKFTCEMSRDYTGKVVIAWFRRTEAPKYLNRDERRQYQAGRDAFLEAPDQGSPRNVPRK
jgi:hypothetical protein